MNTSRTAQRGASLAFLPLRWASRGWGLTAREDWSAAWAAISSSLWQCAIRKGGAMQPVPGPLILVERAGTVHAPSQTEGELG